MCNFHSVLFGRITVAIQPAKQLYACIVAIRPSFVCAPDPVALCHTLGASSHSAATLCSRAIITGACLQPAQRHSIANLTCIPIRRKLTLNCSPGGFPSAVTLTRLTSISGALSSVCKARSEPAPYYELLGRQQTINGVTSEAVYNAAIVDSPSPAAAVTIHACTGRGAQA